MLIHTYIVDVKTTLRHYNRIYGFPSLGEAKQFRDMLNERFGGLQPRMIPHGVFFVTDAAESLAVFEREINEKP